MVVAAASIAKERSGNGASEARKATHRIVCGMSPLASSFCRGEELRKPPFETGRAASLWAGWAEKAGRRVEELKAKGRTAEVKEALLAKAEIHRKHAEAHCTDAMRERSFADEVFSVGKLLLKPDPGYMDGALKSYENAFGHYDKAGQAMEARINALHGAGEHGEAKKALASLVGIFRLQAGLKAAQAEVHESKGERDKAISAHIARVKIDIAVVDLLKDRGAERKDIVEATARIGEGLDIFKLKAGIPKRA